MAAKKQETSMSKASEPEKAPDVTNHNDSNKPPENIPQTLEEFRRLVRERTEKKTKALKEAGRKLDLRLPGL